MTQSSYTFRVFVSSTFSDMSAERNALQKHVFPRLRELAIDRNCRFQAIDLRWGIPEESVLDQQIMRICLTEIKRCQDTGLKPNFIVLLGDRYGWCPLPHEIPADEFKALRAHIADPDADNLREWYELDENAVPPVWCLKPRRVSVPEMATEIQEQDARKNEYEEWQVVETKLRATLLHAIDKAGWKQDDPRRLKYEASATHQEINHGALQVEGASQYAFAFFRSISNLEAVQNALADDGDKNGKRPPAKNYLDTQGSDLTPDKHAHDKLLAVKERLCNHLGDNSICSYQAHWSDSGLSNSHIGELPKRLQDCLELEADDQSSPSLCLDVWLRLSKAMLSEIELLSCAPSDLLNDEIASHEKVRETHTRHELFGRTDILSIISGYINADSPFPHPLVIQGDAGSGKSALLAHAIEQVRTSEKEIIFRFIGVTPQSSSGPNLLRSLCQEITKKYGLEETLFPDDYWELMEVFSELLTLVHAEKKLVIFLDGLDRLPHVNLTRHMTWLMTSLPPHVRLIVSATTGPYVSALQAEVSPSHLIELQGLPRTEGLKLLDTWLKTVRRRVEGEEQRAIIEQKVSEHSLPLYLKFVFEEIRLWKSYDEISGERQLGDDIQSAIQVFCKRLSRQHGRLLITDCLGYLAAAKDGLAEDELLDLLALEDEYYRSLATASAKYGNILLAQEIPMVIWARLYFDLAPYLTESLVDRTSLMGFFHQQMVDVVSAEYLSARYKQKRHQELAEYFQSKGFTRARTLRELPYHYYHLAMESGDGHLLYALIDDEQFKAGQQALPRRVETIQYGIDFAAQTADLVGLTHCSMLRISTTSEYLKQNLTRLSAITLDWSEYDITLLDTLVHIPDASLRSLALIYVAWVLATKTENREFTRYCIRSARSPQVLATAGQNLLFLELVKTLFCRGYDEVIQLLPMLSRFPFRQHYRIAWRSGAAQLKSLLSELTTVWEKTGELSIPEATHYAVWRASVEKFREQLRLEGSVDAFEDQIMQSYGPNWISDAYFYNAVELIHSGETENAQQLIERGIFQGCPLPFPAIRTIAALAEAQQKSGNHYAAEEHIARLQTIAGTMKQLGIDRWHEHYIADALNEMAYTIHSLAGISILPDESDREEANCSRSHLQEDADIFEQMAELRNDLMRGHPTLAISRLHDIHTNLQRRDDDDISDEILISVYAFARLCKEERILAEYIAKLDERGNRVEALYHPANHQERVNILAKLAESDPLCIALIAFCLRVEGLDNVLYEFVQIINQHGAETQSVDAGISQLIKMQNMNTDELRCMEQDILGTTAEDIAIPQGFGLYYFAGPLLCGIWASIVSGAIGLPGALTHPEFILPGIIFMVSGIIAGAADLAVWKIFGLWDNPEMSRRRYIGMPFTLLFPWLLFPLFRYWLSDIDYHHAAVGALLGFIPLAILTWVLRRSHWLFRPIPTNVARIRSVLLLIAAVGMGYVWLLASKSLVSSAVLVGFFFTATLQAGLTLSIVPKRQAVLRYYRSRNQDNSS